MATTDPYAAIRSLNFQKTDGVPTTYDLESGQRTEVGRDRWDPEGGWEALGGFQSKYNGETYLDADGVLHTTLQQPGKHKYDTLAAQFRQDPSTGKWILQGDPTPTRATSSKDKVQDFAEKGALFTGAIIGAGYGLSAMAGGAGAGAGAAAGGTAGATSAETLALMQANGMTAAEIAAATGGQAAGFTAADVAAMSAASGAGGTGSGIATLGGGPLASSPAMSSLTPMGGVTAADAGLTTVGGLTAPQVGGAVGAAGAGTAAAGGTAAATTGVKAVSTGLSVSDWLGLGSVAAGLLNKPKTPDTSGLNAAASDSAALGRDSFNWFKSEYEKTAPDRAAATARDNAIGNAQLEAMKFATQEAKDASTRNKTVFQPMEDKMVADAKAYDTPERRAAAIAETTAGVESAFGRAQQGQQRALMRMSATPNTTANAALMQDAAMAKAKAIAGETGATSRNIEQQGYARVADATALGKGVISNQATQQQIATTTGNAGVAAGAGQVAAANSGLPAMQAGTSAALQGLQTAGSLYGQAAQIGNQTRSQDLNFLGNAFNAYMRPSDKRIKKGTGKVTDGSKELAEVNATPVEKDWQYDPAKGGPDDGGQVHTGPMAQSVRETMGDDTAPGGKVIDMAAMGGKLMAGVQALSREVSGIKAQLARMSPAKEAA